MGGSQGKPIPGPMGLPFCGYKPFLKDVVYKDVIRLSKEYDSSVVALDLGSEKVVVLNSIDAIKTLNDGPSDRMESFFDILNEEGSHNGILFNNGPIQQAQRKFASSVVEFSGSEEVEAEFKTRRVDHLAAHPRIRPELRHLDGLIESLDGKPVDVGDLLAYYALNLQGVMLYGRRYAYDSYEMKVLHNNVKCLTEIYEDVTLAMALKPWMKNIPCNIRRIKSYFKSYAFLRNFLKGHFSEHKANFDPEVTHDFISLYIKEQENQRLACSDGTPLTDKDAVSTMIDLLFEAYSLSVPLIQNALVVLAMHPECILKMQEEIDEKFKRDQGILLTQVAELPYTHSVYNEITRWASPIGFTLPVCSKEKDVEILGFTVEKGTRIVGNVYAVHHDKNIWDNPDEFDPKNFMDEDGQPKNLDYVMNYGFGPRSYVGKSMTAKEVFVTMVTMVQRYDIKLAEGAPKPDLYPRWDHFRFGRGIINSKLIITKRK